MKLDFEFDSSVFVSRFWTCLAHCNFEKKPEAKDAQNIFGPKKKNNSLDLFKMIVPW